MIFLILCAAGVVCIGVAPVSFDILGGEKTLRLNVRYLCFKYDVSRLAKERLQMRLNIADFPDIFKILTLFARRPPRVTRFCLKISFSSGDAAETALLYGYLCILFRALNMKISHCEPELTLTPRFLSYDTFSFDCDMVFSIPAAALLLNIITFFWKR
ncbi:MAG: hypothetical protein LBC27_06120 [Spirochaetaceae bacterium]|nr:hypothetical protein [Spirochaetaceae bacterium]